MFGVVVSYTCTFAIFGKLSRCTRQVNFAKINFEETHSRNKYIEKIYIGKINFGEKWYGTNTLGAKCLWFLCLNFFYFFLQMSVRWNSGTFSVKWEFKRLFLAVPATLFSKMEKAVQHGTLNFYAIIRVLKCRIYTVDSLCCWRRHLWIVSSNGISVFNR